MTDWDSIMATTGEVRVPDIPHSTTATAATSSGLNPNSNPNPNSNHHPSPAATAATAAVPFRASKRRAEELASLHYPGIQGAASRDMGIAGLEVSDFEQMKPHQVQQLVLAEEAEYDLYCEGHYSSGSNNTNNSNNNNYPNNNYYYATTSAVTSASNTSANPNSYFCIGSGAGCVDRSVSQTCLTRELEQLPMNHREHVGQDLYGLAEECIPDADESLLEELESAITSLLEKGDSNSSKSSPAPPSNTNTNSNTNTGNQPRGLPITRSAPELSALVPYHAYRLALSLSPSYVRNPAFRLMFLRSTEGDAKKAAKRLTRHFKTKLRLFGEDRLVRDIVLDDLDDDDMESLRSGGFQVLPQRDAAGRSVLFGRYTAMRYKTIDNMLRALWYIWMSLVEDPVNQKKGVVALGYEVGKVPLDRFGCDHEDRSFDLAAAAAGDSDLGGGFDRKLAREIVAVPLSVPARPVGYHLCTDSHQWVGMLNMVMVTLCKFIRLRMRIHHGTDLECRYALMTHGMPTEEIPVDAHGGLSLDHHLRWIEERRTLDAQKMHTGGMRV